jgi:hypothetical protein
MLYDYIKYILGECFDMVMGDSYFLLEVMFVVGCILYKTYLQRYGAIVLVVCCWDTSLSILLRHILCYLEYG